MLTLKGWSLQALVLSLSMITIRTPPVLAGLVRKMVFFSHIYIKMLILPRQARDKHRENSKKDCRFPSRVRCGLERRVVERDTGAETAPIVLAIFSFSKRSFAKTGSGSCWDKW